MTQSWHAWAFPIGKYRLIGPAWLGNKSCMSTSFSQRPSSPDNVPANAEGLFSGHFIMWFASAPVRENPHGSTLRLNNHAHADHGTNQIQSFHYEEKWNSNGALWVGHSPDLMISDTLRSMGYSVELIPKPGPYCSSCCVDVVLWIGHS